MQYHAFLSYSHADAHIMRRVREELSSAGLSIWSDEQLVPGTLSWKNAIEDAIQNALTLVVLLSPDAKHSDWIEKEIDYARACEVTIVPVLVRGEAEISAVPFELINVQRIDLRQHYDHGMQQLITTLENAGSVAQPSLSAHTSPPTMERLNPISIYDHVRLFSWVFYQPQQLALYRNRFGDEDIRRTSAWLVADLAWIAFLAPAIGIVLGTVQVPTDDPTLAVLMQGLSGVIFLGGWFITGWLGWRDEPQYAMILLVGTTLIITGLFASVVTVSGVILSDGGGWTRPPFLILTGVMLSASAGIAFRLSTMAAGVVAGLLLGSLLFNALFGVQIGIEGGFSALVMFITALLVAHVADQSMQNATRTPLHLLALILIGVSGVLMIAFYFLGGWLFLQTVGV
ncbi:MAG: toll/interleukin-1 receptor domain-containing protein [Anaerolineae bacterium]